MQQEEFVDKFYIMDPREDDLLFDSRELRNGMLILVASYEKRANTATGSEPMYPERRANAMMWNRWMVVSNLFQEEDNTHFIGNFNDGTKMKFSVNPRTAWLVKVQSVSPTGIARPYTAQSDPLTADDWPPANSERPSSLADTKYFDKPVR